MRNRLVIALLAIGSIAAAACGSSSSGTHAASTGSGTGADTTSTTSSSSGSGFASSSSTTSSSSSTGSSSSGSLLDVEDQIAFYKGSGEFEVKLSSYANACMLEQADDSEKASSSYISIYLQRADGTETLPPTGTYSTADMTPYAIEIRYQARDAQCNDVDDLIATSGTVVLTSVSVQGVQGSFTATMNGQTVSMSFDAPTCDLSAPTASLGCVQ